MTNPEPIAGSALVRWATLWANLLGWNVYHDDDPEVVVAPSFPHEGTGMLFIPVPEGKTAKNRMHLDVAPDEGTRDEAVERAPEAGSTITGDHRKDDRTGLVTLADPEGNEFCIERGAAEPGPRTSVAYRIGCQPRRGCARCPFSRPARGPRSSARPCATRRRRSRACGPRRALRAAPRPS